MILLFLYALNSFLIQFPISFRNNNCRNEKGQDIRYRHGIQYTVQTEEHWQKQGEAHAEYHLTEHGQERGRECLTYCLQEDEACLVDAGEDHHAEISTEGFDGEIGVVAAPIIPMSIPAVSIIAAKINMAVMVIMSKTKGRFLVKTPFEIEMD